MRIVAVVVALALAAPARAQEAPDLPRVPEPSRQVQLKAGEPAPFEGALINAARAREIAAASPTAACERERKTCEGERDAYKAQPAGVAVGTVAGVVIVVAVVGVAVGVVVGAVAVAQGSK